ncbi:thioredoxin domain-containing protein [Halosimplex rubrum]|uniref:Thioredoxin domain-containing protein n=1 Tax=Halosimplex rubrum TaxID=869889 RepID=A0A7D5P6V4_9EURY|nr:thioredoxin domain-containing protein [Halosimplex rubrum]QLH78842.1 thioredoxin domain-containing protein [Halosimplex rubrum]
MTDADPTARNRLDEEESPYLRQHADNPVDWQPWDEAALAAAEEQDKPIFLSIGYAACHWCHVMEAESFEDEGIAELLNEQFVPIKVDREERPDIDSIYMSICQQVSGRGGWPLNAWLTPEGEPFYVGTYFPPEPKRGTPGFRQLLEDISESWADPEQREEMESRARQWTEAIADDLESTPDGPGDAPDEDVLDATASAALRGADREFGGWGKGQKFPQPGRLRVLMRAHRAGGRDDYREVVAETLDAMGDGGLYDHVGGGFHRYTTDREWVVPHFEKMLYDNAELARVFLTGYQFTGRERYRETARETLEFVERELTHPDGGFYSTLDAESEVATDGSDLGTASGERSDPRAADQTDGSDHDTGERGAERPASEDESGDREEGAFYVWTPDGVDDAVAEYGPEHGIPGEQTGLAAEIFRERYGVTATGNFEDGTTVLTRSASVESLADDYELSTEDAEGLLDSAKAAVFEAREARPRPPRDEKVLAGWNGLMVSAYAEAAIVDDDAWAEPAVDALAFAREHLWDADSGRLSRRFKDGNVDIRGYLEDYAFLARGAFDTYGATGEVEHLAFAVDLARTIEAEFWDESEETLYFTPQSGESLVARPQELADQSTPSSAGVAAELLLSLDPFVDHDRFESVASGVLATHGGRVESNPQQHPSLALAADTYRSGAHELTLAAESMPRSWRETLADTYVPRRLLAPRPATDDALAAWLDALELTAAPPVWASRAGRDGEPTVYACRSRTCSPPTHDLSEALDWFQD